MCILNNCSALHPSCIAKIVTGDLLPKGGFIWKIENELKPLELYLYLRVKFGPPNGLQNLFRRDDSDNLIHWEWTLAHENGLISIMGLNMRTEVHFMGKWNPDELSVDRFIEDIKGDYKNFGKEMSKFRKESLEHWDLFTNPYHDINSSINQLVEDLDNLNLRPSEEQLRTCS